MGILKLSCGLLLLVGCGYDTARTLRAAPAYDTPKTRDKLQWPFSVDSIWNTPIGSQARYKPAALHPVTYLGVDTTRLVVVRATDPMRDLFDPGPRPGKACTGTVMNGRVQVPDDFVLPAGANDSPANGTSMVQPDGHTLIELTSVARCAVGGPVFGYRYPSSDLLGPGISGGQGGSGLSALGGALRAGELTGDAPVRHALKIAVWGFEHLFNDPAAAERCFRWPADRCDAAASLPGMPGYHGSDPSLVMGSLLAIPPTVTVQQLGLKTRAGFKVFFALQDFGAYVAGNAATDGVLFGFNDAGVTDFERVFGHGIGGADSGAGKDWFDDVNKVLPHLAVVDNNAPASIGGGGAPRVPLAPPLPP